MKIELLYELFLKYPTISTDTRKIGRNCLFFALKGPNFNGNTFAQQALDSGAAYAIIDEEEYLVNDTCILVEDVLKTLQLLGTHHRLQSNATIVALTGSNGKTTTKELIHAVLSQKFKTIATRGNLNNHIGVPLTLLSIQKDTEIAIVEMGANHQKEIAFLCSVAQPDHGYITNFGKAHLEGFGSFEGVIKGKSEMYDHLMTHGKHIFWNADDPIQQKKLRDYNLKTGFSTDNTQYECISFLGADPTVKLKIKGETLVTQLPGAYNFANCAIAALMGIYFRVPISDIKKGIETYQPENNRSQLIEKNGIRIMLDAYNANPSSMKVALEAFDQIPALFKTVLLGDMFELGDSAAEEHQRVSEMAEKMPFHDCFLVGAHFYDTDTSCKKFRSFESFLEYLDQNPIKKGSLLIKGSRGMALERVMDLL
ncbi:UDP-N-acetylmuramoyl-tripeptide--D-alanyl-D-alanine ligase [uncultured Muriicola sp.]|uniref:UDP-N-acetylmuramoyl-tripeptide--D-alanyl-D- alanine ligase n=1 Tax=uncultured Muriicola sp. TaxID=1583102 RepID=UPI002627CA60|nr:UDP-N-acetylmuramoyl-tripeptide--D-alanyl-D-alanine ligase [uncultured Muriicola sp.]